MYLTLWLRTLLYTRDAWERYLFRVQPPRLFRLLSGVFPGIERLIQFQKIPLSLNTRSLVLENLGPVPVLVWLTVETVFLHKRLREEDTTKISKKQNINFI